MKLTTNFTLEEFTKSQTAIAKGIDNTPNNEELENIKFMAEQLELIRNAYKKPIYITSGFRSEELNNAVGGSSTSYHKRGLAVDINQGTRTRNKNLFELVRSLMKVGLMCVELIDEKNYSWLHLSFDRDINKQEVLHLN